MKSIFGIIVGLLLIFETALAGDNYADTTSVSRGSIANLAASRVLDNVSSTLYTDADGRFEGVFSFTPDNLDDTGEFILHIAFNGRGKYRFSVQKANGRWENLQNLNNPSNGFQTLSFRTSQVLSNYLSNGVVRLRLTASRRSSGMNLDFLSLQTQETEAPVNTAPLASDIQSTTSTSTAIRIDLLENALDADGDVLVPSITALPMYGSVVWVDQATVNYVPNAGFTGTDSFQYSVDDGNGGSATAMVSIVVVNDNVVGFVDIPLVSEITTAQPMTGIVLWAANHNDSLLKTSGDYIQLEFAYINPAQIVSGQGLYNWAALDTVLEGIRGRGKQAVLRWAYVLPGQQTRVPSYIKALPGYNETTGATEGQLTHFPDWSNATFQNAHRDMFSAFAARYDNDPRVAFLQVGFGLWGEYHIYDPGVVLGVNFPSFNYQASFLNHMDNVFGNLQWSLSIDAGAESVSPLYENADLMSLNFGLFDDSFMHGSHDGYNEFMWNRLQYPQRYEHSVHGGELGYYTVFDQQHALDVAGIHGSTFEQQSAKFHITYMMGNDQPSYQSNERIRDAGLATGYKFEITSFQASANESRVTVRNNGVAPIYYDAYVNVNGVASTTSLKGLLPGASVQMTIASGGALPALSIESNHLVSGQRIEFEANL